MSYVILAFGAQLSVYVGMLLTFMREKCPSYLIFGRTILFVNLIFQVWLYHLVMSWLYVLVKLIFHIWLHHSVMFGRALLVELIFHTGCAIRWFWLYAFGQIDISYLVASFGDVWS